MSDAHEPAPLDTAKLVFAALSDPGRVRPENQDASALLTNVSGERLLVVADGMGGQNGGEKASKLCIETLGRAFRDPHGTPAERLRRGLELANEEVYGHALSNPELKGMGTTAVALLFGPGTRGVWLAWVGDSRCYRLRAGALEALTRDHSLMAEWIAMGVIGPEDVEMHPRRHELTRAVGQSPDVAVEVVPVDIQPGDRFLLCSDGVHALVPDRAIKAALAGHPPEEAVRLLIERANANGGSDNATALVAEVPPEAITAAAIEPPPEVPLELELPSPPPPPAPPAALEPPAAPAPPTPPAAPPQPQEAPPASAPVALEIEPTSHASAAIDAALAELEAARAAPSAPILDPTPSAGPPALDAAPPPSSEEDSFAGLLDDMSLGDASQEPLAVPPAPIAPAAAQSPGPTAAPFAASGLHSPALVAPPPPRAVRIPLMTPVRSRRGLHAGSLVTGLAVGALVAALAAGAWVYTGMGQLPMPARPDVPREVTPPREARAPIPAPEPARAPEPESAPTPEPAPEPAAAAAAPTPAAREAAAEPAPTRVPAPPSAPARAPIPVTDAPPPGPTTVVIVRPQSPPPAAVPAAPDAAALPPTAEGFELSPPVRRFVDDWLRAQATHDTALFTSLGFRQLPTELAGTWATRDAWRLVAASIDEERSTPERVYLRLVVSYVFSDATGRFRTQDEERLILRAADGALRFEGRWQQ